MLYLILFFSFFSLYLSTNLPEAVINLDVNNYLGHWINLYASPTNFIFQGYGKCLTADYGIINSNNISVLNTQLNINNEIVTIYGYGYYKNISEPGELTVHLNGVPTDSPYWVVKLGEIVDDQYQYSIVTIPSGISVWVLVRDLISFYKYYDAEVKKFLNDYEFKYITISQDNC
jgi:lipocalin